MFQLKRKKYTEVMLLLFLTVSMQYTDGYIVELCHEKDRAGVLSALSAMTKKNVLHIRSLKRLPALIIAEPIPDKLDSVEGVCKIHESRTNRISLERRAVGELDREAVRSEIAPKGTWWHRDRINQDVLPLDGDDTIRGDGRGVNIFVLDTGLDTGHNEFGRDPSVERSVRNIASYVPNESFEYWPAIGWKSPPNDTSLLQVNDVHGHGTFTSGTAAGSSLGVAPGANLYHMKVLGNDGSGKNEWSLYAMERVAQLVAEGKVVGPTLLSCSFGDTCDSGDPQYCESEDVQARAVDSLVQDLGLAVVVSAGNNADNGCFYLPQSSARAISVAASDQFDRVANWSNFGACVDIVAPGVDMPLAKSRLAFNETLTEKVPAALPPSTTEYVSVASGTSFAAPLVAGTIALYSQLLGHINTVSASRVVLQKAKTGILHNEDTCPTNHRLLRVPNGNQTLDDLPDHYQSYPCPEPPPRTHWPPPEKIQSSQAMDSSGQPVWGGTPPPFTQQHSDTTHEKKGSKKQSPEHFVLSTYGHPLENYYYNEQRALAAYHRRQGAAVAFLTFTICAGIIITIYRRRHRDEATIQKSAAEDPSELQRA